MAHLSNRKIILNFSPALIDHKTRLENINLGSSARLIVKNMDRHHSDSIRFSKFVSIYLLLYHRVFIIASNNKNIALRLFCHLKINSNTLWSACTDSKTIVNPKKSHKERCFNDRAIMHVFNPKSRLICLFDMCLDNMQTEIVFGLNTHHAHKWSM